MRRNIRAVFGVAVGLLALERSVRAAFSGDRSRPSGSAHTYVLEREQTVPSPIDRVFPFFADPANLAEITPPWMGFQIRRLEGLPLREGTKIEYRIRPLGLPQRWATEIVEYEPGRRFADVQIEGPYRYWRHEHVFDDTGGQTLVRDRVEYQMPLGPVGRLVHALVVASRLRSVFDYRRDAISRRFGPHRGAES